MTIDELITELNSRRERHGGGTEVIITWEGTTHEITPAHVYLSVGDDGRSFLMIDADGNLYKDKYAHPDEPNRGIFVHPY